MENSKSVKDSKILIIIGGLVFLGLFTFIIIVSKSSNSTSDDIELGFLAISYQVIFLTTSLLGMLSDKSETIYWERFTEYVMVNPPLINFIGLSIAGYVSLLVQTICYFITSWKLVYYISFSAGIAIIIILWWKMSSIFYRRDYYLNQLKEKEQKKIKELQIKNDLEEKDKINKDLDLLREFTYSAIDNHSYRPIGENLDYLIETICCCEITDIEIVSEFSKTIVLIMDYLYSHNEEERIIDFLTTNSELLSNRLGFFCSFLKKEPEFNTRRKIVNCNRIVAYEISEWLIKDVGRLGIWKALRDRIITDGDELYYLMYYTYARYYPYSVEIEKGKEDYARSLQTQYDDVEKIIGLRDEYEKFIVYYATFALENDLTDELEVIIEFLIKNPDLIKACPKISPLLDPFGVTSSLDLVFNLIEENDHRLSLFITAYSMVVFMAKHGDIQWDSERDEEIVERIMNIYNKKTEHDDNLKSLYETFMLEFVPATSVARKTYVERLAETKDYLKLKSVISYDNNVWDFIKNQIDDSSESYYRVFLYLMGNDCSIVCPIESVYSPNQDPCVANSANEAVADDEDKNDTEIHDDPETDESAKTKNDLTDDEQKEVVLEDVKTSLIKMEFRPTGKNKDEMIDFWNDIRRRIPESEGDVLGELDDYISIIKNDSKSETGN